MKKNISLNKLLLIVLITGIATFAAWTSLSWYAFGKEKQIKANEESYSIYDNIYDSEVYLTENNHNTIESLFENINVDETKNILYMEPAYDWIGGSGLYEPMPFFIQDEEYKKYYLFNKPEIGCFGSISENGWHHSNVAAAGRLVIPSIHLSIPIYLFDGSSNNNIAYTETFEKEVNVVRNWRDVNQPNEMEVVIGHSVSYGMGATVKTSTQRGVALNDLAYLIKADGTVKIYKAVRIDAHANQESNNVHGYDKGVTFYWSDGELVYEDYNGTEIDLLYTDCCNDIIDEEGYSYLDDPGNYSILWEKLG